MGDFRTLDAWRAAILLAEEIYLSTKSFPFDERFGLTSQLRRAAVSVSSNIAEGSSRSPADFARMLTYAIASLAEIEALGWRRN